MRGSRGFTMTEMAVATLVTAVVAGVGFYFIKAGVERHQFTALRTELIKEQEVAFQAVTKLMDEIVRVNGRSLAVHPPISKIVNPTRPEFEELRFIHVPHPQVTARIGGVENLTASAGTINLLNRVAGEVQSSETFNSDSLRAVVRFLTRVPDGVPILFSSPGEDNLLQIQRPASENRQFTLNLEPLVASGLSPARIRSLLESDTKIGMTALSRVFVDVDEAASSGPLVLETNFAGNVNRRELLQKVSSVRFLFSFDTYQRPQGSGFRIPNRQLSSPLANDATYAQLGCAPSDPSCCNPAAGAPNPCLDQSDLSDIVMVVATERPISRRGQAASNLDGFTVEEQEGRNYLKLTRMHSHSPRAFAAKSSLFGQAQSIACRNPRNRCKPGCDGYFTGTNPRAPNWSGYGRHVFTEYPSSYCRCGTRGTPATPDDIVFTPPETEAGANDAGWFTNDSDPNTNDFFRAENARVNACTQHFNEIQWVFRHPMMFTWWNGIAATRQNRYRIQLTSGPYAGEWRWVGNGPQGFVESPTRIGGAFVGDRTTFEDFRADYEAFAAGTSSSSHRWDQDVTCRLGRDNISWHLRWIYLGGDRRIDFSGSRPASRLTLDDPAQPASSSNRARLRPWEELCGCRTFNVPSWNAEWACNHRDPDTEPMCPNTWAGERVTPGDPLSPKVYRVRSLEFAEGLATPDHAGLCECLAQHFPTIDVPVSEGWALSNWWDFRVPPESDAFSVQPIWTAQGHPAGAAAVWPPNNNPLSNHSSSSVRSVTVNFRTEASGLIRTTNRRCPDTTIVAGGSFSFQSCFLPQRLNANQRASIQAQLQAVYNSAPAQFPFLATEADRERWGAFCNPACFQEGVGGTNSNAWPGADLYERTGVKQVRRIITNVGVNGQIPTWCGGRPPGGFGGG